MNHLFTSTRKGGGNSTYSTPAIDILDVATEKGFAQSTFDQTDSTENSGYDETSPEL